MTKLAVKIVFCVFWLVVVGAGFAVFSRYEAGAGTSGTPLQYLPGRSSTASHGARYTLLFFAHPHCPCTRASVDELNRLLAKCEGKLAAEVWLYRPASASADWTHTGLRKTAESLPGVSVHEDVDGAEARRYGADTSGFVVLYDPQGKLVFHGGITSGRGHAGDNAGEDAIISWVTGQSLPLDHTPVFGCPVLKPSEKL